jgi:diacylglycerol kinase (ATP)
MILTSLFLFFLITSLGNDLARCLRWGGGYEGESIPKLFDKISRSEVVMMDRWNVSIEPAIDKEEMAIPAHKVLKVIEGILMRFLCIFLLLHNLHTD